MQTPALNGNSKAHTAAVDGPSIPSSHSWGRQGSADAWELREQVCGGAVCTDAAARSGLEWAASCSTLCGHCVLPGQAATHTCNTQGGTPTGTVPPSALVDMDESLHGLRSAPTELQC